MMTEERMWESVRREKKYKEELAEFIKKCKNEEERLEEEIKGMEEKIRGYLRKMIDIEHNGMVTRREVYGLIALIEERETLWVELEETEGKREEREVEKEELSEGEVGEDK